MNDVDRKALNSAVQDLQTDGMTEEEIKAAENLAIDNFSTSVEKELDQISSRVEKLGGTVEKFDESSQTPKAQPETLKQFTGETSPTAPVENLNKAKKMKDSGASNESIRRQTGWFKGVDNKWRYEISDDAAALKVQIGSIKERVILSAHEIIDHPVLFGAYPDMRNTKVIVDPNFDGIGMYNPSTDAITISTAKAEKEALSTLLHEIQHAIQEREGFARGGSANPKFTDAVKRALASLRDFNVRESEDWTYRNQVKMMSSTRASKLALDSLMYKSSLKLMEYANHAKPSSVFRHVRNEVQWLYNDRFQQDRAMRDEVNEVQRMFYDIPRRGPKRNQKIAEIAFRTSQILRENLNPDNLRIFKNDSRTVTGMIKALEREAGKKKKELEPLRELEKKSKAAKNVESKSTFKTPFQIYEALAGEIEARTTQARQHLTAEERKDRDVLRDMDVPPDEAIVIVGGHEILAPSSMMSARKMDQPDRASFSPMATSAKMVNVTDKENQEFGDLTSISESQKKTILNRFVDEINVESKKHIEEEKARLTVKHTESLEKREAELDKGITRQNKEVAELTKDIGTLTKKNDTIGKFIAKAGGLNRESMKAEGIDPANFKRKAKVFGKPLFPKKGGLTADGVAELLNEQNFRADPLTANDAVEIITDMVSEDNVFVDQEIGAKTDQIYNAIENIESDIRDKKAEKNNGNIKAAAKELADYEVNRSSGENAQIEAEKRLDEIIKEREEAKTSKKWVNPNLEESIIRLSQASDLSSFLHESAHLFLDMEARFADGDLTADQKIILDFLGMDSFSELIIDGEITIKQREAHEKWAETFEVYLREGKAPSSDLREAFAAFKTWLMEIYKVLTDQRLARADLTPEIKEVFDRLLASEVEIEQMKANPAYDSLFKNKEQAGMTDIQWDKYQKQKEKAHNRSQQSLDDKLIKELTKRKTKEWNSERKPLIEEELDKLKEEKVYKLIEALENAPMDIDLAREALGIEKPKKGEKKSEIEKKISKYSKKGGGNPYDYQSENGFNSIEHMFQSLIDAKPIKTAAKENAQQRMIDKHGDILNDGSIEQEVRESVHNEEQAKLALMELRALDRKTPIDRAALKAKAKETIASMKFSEIHPSRYYQAEIKHAKLSVSDKKNAPQHKLQQLANHYLYKEAVTAKERMVKQRKYVRGLQTKKYSKNVVAPRYAQNIRMLSLAYDMKQGDPGKRTSVERIIDWMITQVEDENNFIDFDVYDPTLIEIITDRQLGHPVDYELPAFDDMTSGQLNGLSNQLKHMRFIGGKLAGDTKSILVREREESSKSIDENGGKPIPTKLELSKWHKAMEWGKKMIYSHRRLGGIFQTLDGFELNGVMGKQYTLANRATNKELELTADMSKSMDEAFKGVLDVISSRRFTTIVKGDGQKLRLSNRARFVLGLNWGNKGNKEAVLAGLNEKFDDDYTEADIVKMLSTMSDVEILALDKVWKAKEPLWPEMSGVEVRLKGVAPSKVQPEPFIINGIRLDGGHYRLHYRTDPNDSARSKISTEKTFGDKIKISTASSLNERVGSGGRLVDLELSHLFQDLTEDIHYIAYAEFADSMHGMFKGVNNPVVSSIIKHYGQPYYDNLIESLSAITQQGQPAEGMWKAMRYVRNNLTYAYLAFSIRNIVQQPIAITNAFSQLGVGYTLKGVIDFYAHPKRNMREIKESSAFMNNRTSLVNREAREQLSKIDSLHPKLGAMKNMAFLPQTFMDSLIAYPTWMGAKAKYANENPSATEEDINAHADDMVAKTIGSGLSKDLGSILTKGEAEKQITFMGTFFNLTWNLHVENAQLLKRGKISGMEYARRLGWMAVAPAILSMYLLDNVPEDDEELLSHALKEVGAYNMSSLFGLRDLASTMKGFVPTIPGFKGVEGLVKVQEEMQEFMTGDEEFDAANVSRILRGLQPLVLLPGSGQLARTIDGASDPEQGFWGTLVEGKEYN